MLNVAEISILWELYLDLAYKVGAGAAGGAGVGKSVNVEEEKDEVKTSINNDMAIEDNEDSSDVSDIIDILREIALASSVDLSHIGNEKGDNPIHTFFDRIVDIENNKDRVVFEIKLKKDNNFEYNEIVFNTLLSICPNWMLMENKQTKLPIEILLELLYQRTSNNSSDEKHEIKINYKYVKMLNNILDNVFKTNKSVFNKLTKYRLNEHPRCILHINRFKNAELISDDGDDDASGDDISKLKAKFEGIIYEITNQEKIVRADEQANEMNFNNKVIIKADNSFGIDDGKSGDREEEEESKGDAKSDDKLDNKGNETEENEKRLLNLKQELEEEDDEPLSWFEWVYVFGVESLSCADIITDIIILMQLIANVHLWWTTFR